MVRLRFLAVALLALVFAGNSTQTGRSAGQFEGTAPVFTAVHKKTTTADERACTIYALDDMGYDSDLGRWIAGTIPEMIEPSSWEQQGGNGALRYYAPKNILIIKNSTVVHAKVDSFLKDLNKSLAKGTGGRATTGMESLPASVIPTGYHAPSLLRTSGPVPETSSYPVPAPVKQPKHLFHFLIRYEGEGIIDNNVVKFMKGYSEATKEAGGNAASVRKGYEPTPVPNNAEPLAPPAVSPGSVPAPVSSSVGVSPAIDPNDTKAKEDKKDDKKANSYKTR